MNQKSVNIPRAKIRDQKATTSQAREMVDALVSRSLGPDPNHGSNRFTHAGLVEIAREALRAEGKPLAGDAREVLTRAMTTADFPAVLADVANNVLASVFSYAPRTFDQWTAQLASPDFIRQYFSRVAPPSDLPIVGEDGEFTHLKITDGQESSQIQTRGGILSVSRQALINDNMTALSDAAKMLGLTAATCQSRAAYGALLSNGSLSDGIPIFDAARGNLLTGADSALSRNSLATAVKALRMMSDDQGNPLNIEPKYLLVPPSLEVTAHELCYSDSIPGQSNSAVPNFFKRIGIIPITDGWIESPNLTGGSATQWFLLPDPILWPVIAAVTLTTPGALEPYVESQPGWTTDGIEWKVRTDFDFCPLSWRAVKSAGV